LRGWSSLETNPWVSVLCLEGWSPSSLKLIRQVARFFSANALFRSHGIKSTMLLVLFNAFCPLLHCVMLRTSRVRYCAVFVWRHQSPICCCSFPIFSNAFLGMAAIEPIVREILLVLVQRPMMVNLIPSEKYLNRRLSAPGFTYKSRDSAVRCPTPIPQSQLSSKLSSSSKSQICTPHSSSPRPHPHSASQPQTPPLPPPRHQPQHPSPTPQLP